MVASVLGVYSVQASSYPADTLSRGGFEMSIRTNLLWDAVSEPNIGLEFPVGDHWSVGGNFGLKAWPRWLAWDWDNETNPTHWRNFAVVPEVRYYFNQVYEGLFTGADFLYTHYNVGAVDIPLYPEVKQFRDQGSYWAGGLFVGYAWWPWQHFRLELEAGAAVGLAAYDRFDCPHCGTKVAEERKPAVVPKLAVNIAWNPVSRDKTHQRREAKKASLVYSGTDTITVLTPPVAFVVNLKEVQQPKSTGDRLSEEYSWVIPVEKYRPFDYLTRPGRDSVEYVRFQMDSDVLEPSYSENAQRLDRLQSAIEAIQKDSRTEEVLVSIVGLASIEGPVDRNDTLAVRRARALASYLSDATGLERRAFETIGKGEAWDWFLSQAKAQPEEYSSLIDIIGTNSDPDVREQKLKANRSLYNKVKKEFLEDQRSAGYLRVYYGDASDPATDRLNGPIAKLITEKHYAEAVREIESDQAVMDRVKEDAEAMNAYAVALYFTALDTSDSEAEARALDLLEQAASLGSEAARENLKGTEVYGPARKEYEAWIKVMSEE